MKQFLFILFFFCSCYVVLAQEDRLIVQEATKINRQLVPAPVMDSLYKIFPRTQAIEYYSMPMMAARNAWAVPADSLVPYTDTAGYYLIVNKKGDQKFYTLFAADGDLVMMKLREELSYLPELVQASMRALRKTYPGYRINASACFKNEDRGRRLYYEVIAERGVNRQRFFYDPEGTLVKIDIIARN